MFPYFQNCPFGVWSGSRRYNESDKKDQYNGVSFKIVKQKGQFLNRKFCVNLRDENDWDRLVNQFSFDKRSTPSSSKIHN